MVIYRHQLDQRGREILRIIIRNFIDKGEPVGSRTVSKLISKTASPATVRNVMADLEEMGFLYQPHTSAGRIPTDLAYRFYVDTLEGMPSLPSAEKKFINRILEKFSGEIDQLLPMTSRYLSVYSGNIGIVMSPRASSIVLRRIHLIRIGENKILTLIVSMSGTVYEKIINVEESFTQDELDRISKYLVSKFRGYRLTEIRNKVKKMMGEERSLYDKLMKNAIYFSRKTFAGEYQKGDLYLYGTLNIVDYPEFSDIRKIKRLMETLEEKNKLLKILNQCVEGGDINILIGAETQFEDFEECSFVTGTYSYRDTALGTLAVLGPRRMKYPRAIALVDYISKRLSQMIS